MNQFKKGDKLRSLESYQGLTKGKIYTFDRYNYSYNIVVVEEIPNVGWYSSRFELVEDTLEQQVSEAYELIGKRIKGSNFEWVVDRVMVIKRDDSYKSLSVSRYFNQANEDFCVCVQHDNSTAPYKFVEVVPESIMIDKVGEYSAKVEKCFITVGCQKIPWSKVEEIVEAHKTLK